MNRKHKRWQAVLIFSVIGLTIYNILPTVFFYSKPLDEPIREEQALTIGSDSLKRVNQLENDSIEWLGSFNKLIGVKASDIRANPKNPQIIDVSFKTPADAKQFGRYLPKAGNLIPFYPARLSLSDLPGDHEGALTVSVLRKIPTNFAIKDPNRYFTFGEIFDQEGKVTKAYQELTNDRISEIALAAGGISENSSLLSYATSHKLTPRSSEFLSLVVQKILLYSDLFGEDSPTAKKFYASFTQGPIENKSQAVDDLTKALSVYKDELQMQRIKLEETKDDPSAPAMTSSLRTKEDASLKAISILKKHKTSFAAGKTPLHYREILSLIQESARNNRNSNNFALWVGDHSPLIDSIVVDYEADKVYLTLQPKIAELREGFKNAQNSEKQEKLKQLIYNEIANVSREAGENFTPFRDQFYSPLQSTKGAKSFIRFDLSTIAKPEVERVKEMILNSWNPEYKDLSRENYPIIDWYQYKSLPASQRNLHLVIYAPSLASSQTMPGFKNSSVYVIAKDLGKVLQKIEKGASSESAQKLETDLKHLMTLMRKEGFTTYSGNSYPLPQEFQDDYIFELPDFYQPVLMATREDFTVHGTKQFATLELSNVKDRIITLNKIETAMHEDLIKWRDEYNATKVDPTGQTRFDVPAPTKSILLNNLQLSFRKYFRGDERKILRWGQDLSGGKTVQIALKDTNGKLVTREADIKQGINELYSRVNKMGVSDVSIRQEGSYISLDFPGSQNMSASDLVKASSMTFHVVNENFSSPRAPLYAEANQFLQEVWNEAVVTNKKDIESIQQIAYTHLYGDTSVNAAAQPRSEAAKTLLNAGLKIANPENSGAGSEFDEAVSKIAMYRGENFTDWQGNTNPLLIVFNNYALEGANLENIRSGYDPQQGNYLSFNVASSQKKGAANGISPRKALYQWTSVLSEENLSGSKYESPTGGNGWRMAVILNGKVISAPALKAPIKSSGLISGHFSQREINHLVADLQAGSLSFTPQIISEMSVSPDLGLKERHQGILAAGVALLSVIAIMVGYYRFAGVVASVAVLFNLLIMWATLQNIGASITLAGIAGIILTIGMAVDANVLVFERIREELESGQKIAAGIKAGYKKAFSAVLDSNLTTIIAALILLNFDSGPVKGFAVTLIIGIVSSMFTALFMTKTFFTKWSEGRKEKKLSMLNFVRSKNFNFLRFGTFCMLISIAVIGIGGAALSKEKGSILGMDFTGGFSVTVSTEETADRSLKGSIEKALIAAGATAQDIQVRELGSNGSSFRIFLSKSLEESGKPFYNVPLESSAKNVDFAYEKNPRLVWLVSALEKNGIQLTESSYKTLDQNFANISGQMSETMRNNAVIGLGIALLSILLYITFRFEFKYAISATIGLAFDVFISLALLGILRFLGVPLQIDLNTVAALMTIVGYSLNDTIIVFDRIREDARHRKGLSFREIINHSLNVTLSRTVMTSATTLVVLVALICFGGQTIFGFSLIMAIGVVVGTLSTFFIASTLLAFFHGKEQKKGSNLVANGA